MTAPTPPPSEQVRSNAREAASRGSGDNERLDPADLKALRAIVEGTAQESGVAFFQSLVKHLATAVDARYAFVAEFAGSNTRVRTIAYYSDGQISRKQRMGPGGHSL
jgi:hypothetical protein